MSDEKDPKKESPAAGSAPERPAPVEGATKQFSLKMSSWLSALGSDLDAPAGAPAPDLPLDLLLDQPDAQATSREAPTAEEVSLEAALFPSELPPKP